MLMSRLTIVWSFKLFVHKIYRHVFVYRAHLFHLEFCGVPRIELFPNSAYTRIWSFSANIVSTCSLTANYFILLKIFKSISYRRSLLNLLLCCLNIYHQYCQFDNGDTLVFTTFKNVFGSELTNWRIVFKVDIRLNFKIKMKVVIFSTSLQIYFETPS